MLEIIEGMPAGVIALRAVGRVTGDDYASVLEPAVGAATAGGAKARLLLELGEGFEGYDPSAIAADSGVGLRYFGSFERIAVTTDVDWVRRAVHLFGPLIPGEVRVFHGAAAEEARAWISA